MLCSLLPHVVLYFMASEADAAVSNTPTSCATLTSAPSTSCLERPQWSNGHDVVSRDKSEE